MRGGCANMCGVGRVAGFCVGVALAGCTLPNPEFRPGDVGFDATDDGPSTDDGDTTTDSSDTSESTTESTDDLDTSEVESEVESESESEAETETGEPGCAAPLEYLDCDSNGDEITDKPGAALGLGCEGPSEQTIAVQGFQLVAPDPNSYRVTKAFGFAAGPNHAGKLWAARDNDTLPGAPPIPPNTSAAFLILSTGVIAENDGQQTVFEAENSQTGNGPNGNPDAANNPEPPQPITPELGSNGGQGGTPFDGCDGVNDCSDSLYETWVLDQQDQFNDQIWLQFTVVPPPGVHGFVMDFAMFSAEYPNYLNSNFTDVFVAWSSSESYTGNLTFVDGGPLTSTTVNDVGGFVHTEGDAALIGTGFEQNAATDWRLLRGPATPGVPVELTLFFADTTDTAIASAVLLDNFRWDCEGCYAEGCALFP